MSTRASGNALFGWGEKDFASPANWHAALVSSGLAGIPTYIRKVLSNPGTAQSKAKILATAIGLPDNQFPKVFTVKYFHEALVVYGKAHLDDDDDVDVVANAGGDEGGDAAKASAAAAAATAAGGDARRLFTVSFTDHLLWPTVAGNGFLGTRPSGGRRAREGLKSTPSYSSSRALVFSTCMPTTPKHSTSTPYPSGVPSSFRRLLRFTIRS